MQDRFFGDEPAAIPYSPPIRGSTFFMSGTRAQYPTAPLPPNSMQTAPTLPSWLCNKPTVPMRPLPPALTTAGTSPHVPSALPTTTEHVTRTEPKVAFAHSSTILAHSGFWQLLATTGSRFLTPSPPAAGGEPVLPATVPVTQATQVPGGNRRRNKLAVDMVGRPTDFRHPVHASDADQAIALLTRWRVDGQGKVGTSAWSQPIKDAVRANKCVPDGTGGRDSGADKTAYRPSTPASREEDLSVSRTHPALVDLVKNVAEAERADLPTVGIERNGVGAMTVRFSPEGRARNGASIAFDAFNATAVTPEQADSIIHVPNPSLTTIEKAAAAKVFFETKYHAILKQPQSRDRSRGIFEHALASLALSDRERRRVRAAWLQSQSQYLRELRDKVGVSSFVKLKTIGHGAFGVVSLVRERGSGELYAMKQLRKADMLRKSQEGHIRAERDLLATAASTTRWIVKLAYSFQDVDHLYLVMSYMPGGDLLTLLIERDTFPEQMARFYAAEMILAIQETHQALGAIHRDIKPDNWLFDADGHLAISDFGLATDFRFDHDGRYFDQRRHELLYKHGIDLEDASHAHGASSKRGFERPSEEAPASILTYRDQQRRKKAFSVVGTGNYMPVEVLRGAGYDVRADWWSLGVIVFEMLYGYPPFVSKTRQETRHKGSGQVIQNWARYLRFPSSPRVSRDAQDFITSLICEPADRLGSRPAANKPNSAILLRRNSLLLPDTATAEPTSVADDGSDLIKRHAWFGGIEWSTLHQQAPPFQPQLAHETDTRYFDDDIPAEPLPAPEIAPGVPAAEVVRDPLLLHPTEGQQLLEVRKEYAFKGWTFKKPKEPVYDLRSGWRSDIFGTAEPGGGGHRGRSNERVDGPGSSFLRSLSV
ncbi:hypothetical protein JCM10908_006125 [Rhodotorula pacifica]|uniref:serine/threonine-protein kinase n=1 Tax=Rhodotorula pacifica TaxID=1495444 RepID=UPI00316DAA60